jgi:hypothetical protein
VKSARALAGAFADDLVDQGTGLGGAVGGDHAERWACLPDPRANAGPLGDHHRIIREGTLFASSPGADPQVLSIALPPRD